MQAFAKGTTANMDKTASLDKGPSTAMEELSSVYLTNEIIFQGEQSDRPVTRYGYKIAEMNFLVPQGMNSEVIQNPSIFDLPNSPCWVAGLINIRGNIIPVMNVDKYLNTNTTKKYSSILVLNKSDNKSAIAVMVNDLPVSLEYNESTATTENYPEALRDFIEDGFSQKNNDWIEFYPQKMFKKLAGKINS